MMNTLDLTKYKFPETTKAQSAFPTYNTDKKLLAEATQRGYYCGSLSGNNMFSTLFFRGGSVVFKSDVPEEFRKVAWAYTRALMGSFAPKHEEKEAVCAMLLDELVERIDTNPTPSK